MIALVEPSRVRPGPLGLGALLLVVTVLAAPVLALLGVESNALGTAVGRAVDREGLPGVFEFEHVTYGPGPLDATLFGVVLRGRDGQPMLTAERAFVSLDQAPDIVKDVRTHLVVNRIEVDGFDLTLEWNRNGDLLLTEVFGTARFGLRTRPSPKVDVLIDLRQIVLRRGRLQLGWPGFGFHFDDVSGSGAVKVADGKLEITVPRLGSGAGATWLASGPARLQEACQALPQNARSTALTTAGRLAIPFDAVTFNEFRWQGTGFSTGLELDGAGELALGVDASMAFPREAPLTVDGKVRLAGPAAFFETLSGGRLRGFEGTRVAVTTAGPALELTAGPAVFDRFDAGRVVLDKATLARLVLDLTGPKAVVEVDVDVGALQVGAGRLGTVHASIAGSFGWDGFTPQAFLRPLFSPPSGALGWATAYPATARLDLSVPSAKVASFHREQDGVIGGEVQGFDVRGFTLGGTISKLELAVASLSATGHGSATLNGNFTSSLGWAGIQLASDISATLTDVPRTTLEAVLPNGMVPAATPALATGAIRVFGDPRDPKSLALESPWNPPPPPAAPTPGAPGATP